jgi:hypothetical protein
MDTGASQPIRITRLQDYKIGLCNISSFKVQQPFAQEVLSLNSLCSKFDENPTKTEVYDNSD